MRKLKKALALILIFVFILPVSVFSAEPGTCGENAIYYFADEGKTLYISGTGAIADYVKGDAPFYSERETIEKIVISEGITKIGGNAFTGFTALREVTIPSTVVSAGIFCFYGCSALERINIADLASWMEIAVNVTPALNPYDLYLSGEILRSPSFPAGWKVIPSSAFFNCRSIEKVTVPDSVTTISDSVFYGCSSLGEVTFGTGLYEIGYSAFACCTALESIVLPDSVNYIDAGCFTGCTSLKTATLPANLKTVEETLFKNCSSLESIDIPSGVTEIQTEAFSGCSSLKTAVIPQTVTLIGSGAFSLCSSLEGVTLPPATSVGNSAFTRCSSIKNIDIGKNITYIGMSGFSGCGIEYVNYSASELYSYAFDGSPVKMIYIDKNTAGIRDDALPETITDIFYSGSEEEFASLKEKAADTYGNDVLKTARIHYNAATLNHLHEYAETARTDATCTVSGSTSYKCGICNEEFTYTTAPLGHSYVHATLKEAKCTEAGIIRSTCTRCGDFYDTEIKPTGHSYLPVDMKAPTCLEPGYVIFRCSKCGDSYSVIQAQYEHQYTRSLTQVIEPTCTEGGCTRIYCGNCNVAYITDNPTPPLGHDFDEGTVTKEPTPYEEGVRTFTCKRCKETRTEPIEKLPFPPVRVEDKFRDLKKGGWYLEGIQYCCDKGLFAGMSEDVFGPDIPMTRAMLVTVLYRLEGSPTVIGGVIFNDVKRGSWYYDAVTWASGHDIVSGFGNGIFKPNDPVTREQTAAVFHRYSRFKNTSSDIYMSLDGFKDASDVSDWARRDVGWAVAHGIISGTDQKYLLPKQSATRAQIASILQRYCVEVANI